MPKFDQQPAPPTSTGRRAFAIVCALRRHAQNITHASTPRQIRPRSLLCVTGYVVGHIFVAITCLTCRAEISSLRPLFWCGHKFGEGNRALPYQISCRPQICPGLITESGGQPGGAHIAKWQICTGKRAKYVDDHKFVGMRDTQQGPWVDLPCHTSWRADWPTARRRDGSRTQQEQGQRGAEVGSARHDTHRTGERHQ